MPRRRPAVSDPDRDWRPTADLATLRVRADLLRAARAFFAARDILEVDTPALAEFGVTDPHIDAIPVDLRGRRHYLQTSPEYAMKRLLAAGSPDIFQLSSAFRAGECGPRHQPEFTIVEWYRRGYALDEMIDETCEFVTELLEAAGRPRPPVERWHHAELFAARTGCDPRVASTATLREAARRLVPGFADQGAPGDDRGTWLDLLASHAVYPALPVERLCVVHHYPAEQAALARLDPADPSCAERFELFLDGLELANGYRELTDATEQRRRFDADRARRRATGRADARPDPRLLAALEHGLPDCSGVAVGFDRVLMCAVGAQSIDDVIAFPLGEEAGLFDA